MATYRNLGFDEACDVLSERKRRLESQIIERSSDLEFEPMPSATEGQKIGFGARLLGKRVEVGLAMRSRMLIDNGLKDCADSIPMDVLMQALNHTMWGRLRKAGSVKVWHDRDGRLLHLDWSQAQKEHVDSVRVFRAAFSSVNMQNHHTVRRPGVLALADLSTRVEVTVDCEKVREIAPSDPCHGSVKLCHSEMDAAPTSLFAAIYRPICWNYLVLGSSRSDLVRVGTAQIPLDLDNVAGSLASRLGGLLNRVRRLTSQRCMPIELAVPVIQLRWGLAQETAGAMLDTVRNPFLIGMDVTDEGCLYHVLNCFTAVTTHRRGNIPQRDCSVLEGLSDSLLIQGSPVQRVLQQDLRAA